MVDHKVFDWLGTGAESNSIYLRALNLMWSDEGVDHDLQVFRRAADLLADDPTYWAGIIRETNWRYPLVGCTCLLVSRRHEFFDDLCYRIREGSMVAPQIAVTLGLLHRDAAAPFLESLLDDQKFRRRASQTVSAHRVLMRLGVEPRQDVSLDSWDVVERDYATLADDVVRRHWDFWSNRIEADSGKR